MTTAGPVSTTPAVVACPHNRIKQSVLKLHGSLEEIGWTHRCDCCENLFTDRSSRYVPLCRRCRGPATHGWRAA